MSMNGPMKEPTGAARSIRCSPTTSNAIRKPRPAQRGACNEAVAPARRSCSRQEPAVAILHADRADPVYTLLERDRAR